MGGRGPAGWLLLAGLVSIALLLAVSPARAGNTFPGTTISGTSGSLTTSNTTATGQTGEPATFGGGSLNTMWYSWTAPFSGTLLLQTCGGSTNFDTTLQTFTGSAVGSLTELAENDDACGLQSSNSLNVTAGTTYRIQVDGFASLTGTFTLSWTFTNSAPANDNFSGTTISGSGSTTGTTLGATGQAGEPSVPGGGPTNTVWYSWTAPSNGTLDVDTCGAGTTFDTTLQAFTGNMVSSLTQVASNDDSCNTQSAISLSVLSGTTYRIQVGGFGGATGEFSLGWSFTASGLPPVTGTTICTGDPLPAGAANLSWASAGVNWPSNTYSPQTYANISGTGTQATISFSNSGTFTSIAETNTNTGNGDTAPFVITGGFGAGSSTITFDLSANPSTFVDFCNYHINQSGGGDRITYRAVTNLGTILNNPVFAPAPSPTYTLTSDTADANAFTTVAAGLLGVRFTAPSGELIERVELIWRESSGSTGGQHGLGFGEIAFYAPGADLSLSKTVDNASPAFGSNVTFTITLTNSGPDNAPGVQVLDKLPTGLTFVSASPSQGTYNSATGLWNVGTVNNGASPTLQIVATVTGSGSITNSAEVTSSGIFDPDSTPNDGTGDDVSSVSISVPSAPPAPTTTQACSALTGTWSGGVASSGGITVTRTQSNIGGGTWQAAGADTMNTIAAWSSPAVQGRASLVDNLQWTDSTSVSGDGGTYTFSFSKPVTNPVIHIDRLGGISAGTERFSNSSKWILTSGGTLYRLAGVPHFETYSDNSFIRTLGQSTNGGESSLSSATGTAAGSVMIGGTHSSISFRVEGHAVVIGSAGDGFEMVVCAPQADLSLTKVADNAAPIGGTNVTFTVTLTNSGPDAATGVEVTDQLPAGLTFVSATPSQGSYDDSTGVWNLGTVANGASPTLQIVATASGTGSIVNSAQVTASTYVDPDSNPGDGTGDDFASVTVTPAAVPIVAQDDSYDSPVNAATGATAVLDLLADNGNGADTLNGVPATSGTVTVTTVGSPPAGITLNPDGTVDVAAGASEGIQQFDYQICETAYPVNCATATVRMTVVDMSDTGLPATPQTCVSPLATYTGGDTGTLAAGPHSASYTVTTSGSGYAGTSFADGDSLVVAFNQDAASQPDSFSATYMLSGSTRDKQVIRIYGGRGLPGSGTGGNNAAGSYTFSWTGGTGNASYYDPAPPSAGMYINTPAGFDLSQRQLFGTGTSGGIANGGSIGAFRVLNAENQWYVDLPIGATLLTVTKTIYSSGDGAGQGADSRLPLLDVVSAGPGESHNEWLTISTLLCEERDYSDAPVAGYGGADHVIVGDLALGAAATPETADYDDPNALGDTDDGVVIPALVQGMPAVIPATVSGPGGYLQAWIDWDGDNSFGTSEQVAVNVQDGGAGDDDGTADGTIRLLVNVPPGAVTSQTFARFRLSTATGLGSTGSAGDGEVEDYALTVTPGTPDLSITKVATFDIGAGVQTANGTDDNVPEGTVVTYTYTITNTGNQTISAVSLVDVHTGSGSAPVPDADSATLNDVAPAGDSENTTTGDGAWDQLGPGDQITVTATYTVTRTDLETLQ